MKDKPVLVEIEKGLFAFSHLERNPESEKVILDYVERHKMKTNARTVLTWDEINVLFSLYNTRETGNRNTFIEKAMEKYPSITWREACLIWQGFDRGAEEWQYRSDNYQE